MSPLSNKESPKDGWNMDVTTCGCGVGRYAVMRPVSMIIKIVLIIIMIIMESSMANRF